MDADPSRQQIIAFLRRVIRLARCFQNLTITQGKRIEELEFELARIKEVAERNALGILAITNGAKKK